MGTYLNLCCLLELYVNVNYSTLCYGITHSSVTVTVTKQSEVSNVGEQYLN